MLNRNVFVQFFIRVIFSQLLIANVDGGGGAATNQPSGNNEISNQPSSSSNAPRVADCPPGLEPLSQTNGILLREKKNKRAGYTRIIKNAAGQEMYFAAEEYEPSCDCFGSASLAFNMSIFDHRRVEVLHLMKQSKSSSSYLEVSLPGGNVIGKVKKESSIINRKLKIMNSKNQVIFYINGTSVTLAGGHLKLKVLSLDGKEVGRIKKHHSSFFQDVGISSKDNFNDVTFDFSVDLDVRVKATLLGACLFINEYYFQPSNSGPSHEGGGAPASTPDF
ncbi:phospholipid scramblase 1-like [Contarinia nasturtii]|uniref:phospholipid scramblase 1-like n=1 Tax=Contarinia nasturtii TaxID=265458 RepID=UPI0012D4B521|nr:phospholipid scramblase 1-like [Contarinia nasturtii]